MFDLSVNLMILLVGPRRLRARALKMRTLEVICFLIFRRWWIDASCRDSELKVWRRERDLN